MTTTKQQVIDALAEGDTLESLDCFYDTMTYDPSYVHSSTSELIHCRGDELPEREYDHGYGGVEGEPIICFSDRYVYFRRSYDGSESIGYMPRHPEFVTHGESVE